MRSIRSNRKMFTFIAGEILNAYFHYKYLSDVTILFQLSIAKIFIYIYLLYCKMRELK